jgi:hypothetical protein
MKTLLMIRHAKAGWGGFTLYDFERPLEISGMKDAEKMAVRLKERQLKIALKQLVLEAIQEIKAEKKLSCHEMMDELDSEVKKENKDFDVTKDDAGYYNVCGCPTHMIRLKHMYEDRFQMTYYLFLLVLFLSILFLLYVPHKL